MVWNAREHRNRIYTWPTIVVIPCREGMLPILVLFLASAVHCLCYKKDIEYVIATPIARINQCKEEAAKAGYKQCRICQTESY